MLDFRSHTIKTIQANKSLIFQAIKENLKTEAITIMNNHEDTKNRNYHKGAHICAISCNWATEEAKNAGSGNIERVLSKEARKDPKNWSYSYINVSTAVDYHFEDGRADTVVELRANKYSKDNYVIVLKDGKAAFHKIGDLQILESSTSQQGKDVYYLGPLEFKEYKPGKFNPKYYNNFKAEFLGNYAPHDSQFRGDYAIVIDNGRGAQQFIEGKSWKAIAEEATNEHKFPLSTNTLCKWVRKNKTVVNITKTNGELVREFTVYIARGENMNAAQVVEYAKHEEALVRSIKNISKIICKRENGRVRVEKGSFETKHWTTLTDRETPEYLLDEDNYEHTQTCVNKPLGILPTRTDEKVHKQNYLFECDRISLEKQADIINDLPEELKQAIVWCCYSGSKSIHTVVATNTPDDADSEMRKYIHDELNFTWWNNEADPSGHNAARLARTPNAVRENGRVQKAFLINDVNFIPYDVTDIIEEFKEVRAKKDEERRKLAEKYSNRNYEGVHTLTQLKSWNEKHPSKAKQEAIDLLEGNLKDWNRALAAVRSLEKFGFDEYEIETEAPYNDKWVKSALKKVFGK